MSNTIQSAIDYVYRFHSGADYTLRVTLSDGSLIEVRPAEGYGFYLWNNELGEELRTFINEAQVLYVQLEVR
ncbi:hypothetical protein UFOVP706_26 [uncultured Caudovirales phage]|uniref:Uncharacterized protein n=1 Tax=uncultured Caudovirales phage TaxID=2100421 RepID=A0A6J5NU55_9CAUD|nr:hypothetical protein UFOVP706_26 [uncultured Caudovirales phage]